MHTCYEIFIQFSLVNLAHDKLILDQPEEPRRVKENFFCCASDHTNFKLFYLPTSYLAQVGSVCSSLKQGFNSCPETEVGFWW